MNFKKMSCAEIRELVNSGRIDLFALSKKDLRIIFDKEMEEQFRHKEYDMTLMNQCSEAFSRLDQKKFGAFWNRKYTARDFYEISAGKNLPERVEKETTRTHTRPRRRIVAAIAAAVILMGLLAVGIASYYNPFSIFGVPVRDLLNMRGEQIVTGKNQLDVSGSSANYNSLDELTSVIGFEILHPSQGYEITSIYWSKFNDFCDVDMSIAVGDKVFKCTVHYGDGVKNMFDENKIPDDIPSRVINGRNVYYIELENNQYQVEMYDGEVVYVYSEVDSIELIDNYLNSISE